MVPANDVAALFDWAERNALALFPIPAYTKGPGQIVRSHAADWSRERRQWLDWYRKTGGCNFGVSCGASRLIVKDVDTDDNGVAMFDQATSFEAQSTVADVTPSGGWHVFFQVPEGVDSATLRQPDWIKRQINVRAGNGYVVAPFSTTLAERDPSACDGAYRPASLETIAVAPPSLLAHCAPAPIDPAPRPPAVDDYGEDGLPIEAGRRVIAEARLGKILMTLRQAVPGERNAELNKAAFAIGKMSVDGLFDDFIAEGMLQAEGEALGPNSRKIRSTVRSGLRSAITRPTLREPRSALDALLMAAVPVQPHPQVFVPAFDSCPSGEPLEPIIERLLVEGCVTVLSGASGTGKTTIGASLMAAAAAGLRNFNLPEFGAAHSDVGVRPAAWVFVSYEGGQYMDLHRRAWHEGVKVAETHPERRVMVSRRGALIFTDSKRNVVMDQRQHDELVGAINAARSANLALPLVVAFDNVTSAIEDLTDPMQAACFMRAMRGLADQGIAVLLFAHPPKRGGSAIYGSHIFYSLADIVGNLDVVRRDKGEWTQWIEFDKHRTAPNGRCLELKSRKLERPIMDLPADWGGDPRIRDRALEDLKTPYIFQIQVKWESEKEAAEANVVKVTSVTPKEPALIPIGHVAPAGATILSFGPTGKPRSSGAPPV